MVHGQGSSLYVASFLFYPDMLYYILGIYTEMQSYVFFGDEPIVPVSYYFFHYCHHQVLFHIEQKLMCQSLRLPFHLKNRLDQLW